MSVKNLVATISCEGGYDGCVGIFHVEVDTAAKIPEGWDLMDVIKDSVRGGMNVTDDIRGSSSVQDDQMLCPACTAYKDRVTEDEEIQGVDE